MATKPRRGFLWIGVVVCAGLSIAYAWINYLDVEAKKTVLNLDKETEIATDLLSLIFISLGIFMIYCLLVIK